MLNYHSGQLRSKLATSILLGLVFVTASECNIPNANTALTELFPAQASTLQLTGSSTMAPLMIAVAQRFQGLYPKVTIKVATGGSGRGIGDARSGNSDIGMASRVMTKDEKDLFGFPIARDGLGDLINQHNRIVNLSEQELLGIFTGKISNWRQVGGEDAAITVISRDEGRGSTEFFTHHYKIKHAEILAHEVRGDNNEAVKAVEADLQGITIMSIVAGENSLKAGAKIKLVSLNGVAATSRNIVTSDDALTRPLTLVTKGLPVGLAKEFIEFALSSQTVDNIRKIGFVPYQD
jgi:phosphate transport system substrate-binding protein